MQIALSSGECDCFLGPTPSNVNSLEAEEATLKTCFFLCLAAEALP